MRLTVLIISIVAGLLVAGYMSRGKLEFDTHMYVNQPLPGRIYTCLPIYFRI
jgi:hypothetical protein